jgi:phenylpyruvate tautomerase PptA (4-oxalocrotonate tautomerase family)
MPLIKIETNATVPAQQQEALLAAVSQTLAAITHKAESHCQALLVPGAVLFAGKPGPSAFVDIRGIGGLHREVNAKLSAALATQLQQTLGVPADRLYINFTEIAATNWGWNGALFG